MNSVFAIVLAIISSGALGSIATILFARRKTKAETSSIEIDNAQKVINIWKDLSEELNQQVKTLEVKVDDMQNDIKVMEQKYKEQCDNCEYKKAYYKDLQ